MGAYVDTTTVFEVVDLLGVFFGALTGALIARGQRYDIMGLWFAALFSGLGGGIVRDVMINAGPPLALTEITYLPTVAVATAVAAVLGTQLGKAERTILVVDSFPIPAFAGAGRLRALDYHLGPWATILLGVITAVGGGMIRDMMMGKTPTVFRKSELFGLAALGVCIVVLILREMGATRGITVPVGIGVGMFLRLGSLTWGWMSWEPKRHRYIDRVHPALVAGFCGREDPATRAGCTRQILIKQKAPVIER